MTRSAPHRKLIDHLQGWSPEQVAELLRRRPDLAHPRAPGDLTELSHLAQRHPSVEAAIATTTLPENRLLQLLVCCRSDVPLDELARALPPGVGLEDVDDVLSSLERSALAWRYQGRVHSSGTLRQAMPTSLGPPLAVVVRDQTVEFVKGTISALRRGAAGAAVEAELPPRSIGPDGRPPRKAELVDELGTLVSVPALVASVLAGAPPGAAELAQEMAVGSPFVELAHPLYHSSYGMGRSFRDQPAYWLFERALVFPHHRDHLAVQPREVGVSLRGGCPVADLALARPELVAATVTPEDVDGAAGERVARTLDRLAELIERWAEAPAKTLKAGGLGVTVMKQTAAALETDVVEAARLVELARLAGLLETTTVTRRENRRPVVEYYVGPVPAAIAWLSQPAAERWYGLVAAWLDAEHWPSASGVRSPGGPPVAVMSGQIAGRAHESRRRMLDVLATLGPAEATSAEALAARVYWERPQPWLRLGMGSPSTAVAWVYAEAELLGLVAHGSPSSFGRPLFDGALFDGDGLDSDQFGSALLDGAQGKAVAALDAVLPAPTTTFTLQGDLTATVVGRLDRPAAQELRLMADVESRGPATTLRFSESSLRRAFDAGRDGAAILAFLEGHAAKGVPPALAYLVGDVDRRHGHLLVGEASSVVTSEDPVVLADACSHTRTRKLALRLLAPTVAVSNQAPSKVMEALRAAGFLPAAEDGAGAVSLSSPADLAGADAAEGGPAEPLSPPYRFRPAQRRIAAPALDEATALGLARSIVAGGAASGQVRTQTLDVILTRAVDQSRVLGVMFGDEDDESDPLCLAISSWNEGEVVGVDLADGAQVSFPPRAISGVIDLGPVEEFATLALFGPARNRAARDRRP